MNKKTLAAILNAVFCAFILLYFCVTIPMTLAGKITDANAANGEAFGQAVGLTLLLVFEIFYAPFALVGGTLSICFFAWLLRTRGDESVKKGFTIAVVVLKVFVAVGSVFITAFLVDFTNGAFFAVLTALLGVFAVLSIVFDCAVFKNRP